MSKKILAIIMIILFLFFMSLFLVYYFSIDSIEQLEDTTKCNHKWNLLTNDNDRFKITYCSKCKTTLYVTTLDWERYKLDK